MQLPFSRTFNKVRRFLMSLTNGDNVGSFLDPPYPRDGVCDDVNACWFSISAAQLQKVLPRKDGIHRPMLELGKIDLLQYCKEDNGVQHEFIRARVRQSDQSCYWVVIQRGTDYSAFDEASNASSVSLPDVGHFSDPNNQPIREHEDDQADVIENLRHLNVIKEEPCDKDDTPTQTVGSPQIGVFSRIKRKAASLRPSTTSKTAKSWRQLKLSSSGGATRAVDSFYRDKNAEIVVMSARPRGPTYKILQTATFEMAATKPTLADLVLAARTVTLAAPSYTMITMCYFYAMFTFELICRSKQFKGVNIDAPPGANRCGKFYWFRKTDFPRLWRQPKPQTKNYAEVVNSTTLAVNMEEAKHVQTYLRKYFGKKSLVGAAPAAPDFNKVALTFENSRAEHCEQVAGVYHRSAQDKQTEASNAQLRAENAEQAVKINAQAAENVALKQQLAMVTGAVPGPTTLAAVEPPLEESAVPILNGLSHCN